MIKRILEVRIPLTLAIVECSKAPSALNAKDYVILENLIQILSPFEEATKKISGENCDHFTYHTTNLWFN